MIQKLIRALTVGSPTRKGRHPDWEEKSTAFKKGKHCARCGGVKNLEVHHIKSFHEFPELEMVESNWIVLCMDPGQICHYQAGHGAVSWNHNNPHVIEDALAFLMRRSEIILLSTFPQKGI